MRPSLQRACRPAANNADDCNDENKRINPGQPEVCDLVDNNCDGSVDNAATDEHVWFIDGDGDGYGESSATTTNCDPYAPSRFSAVSTDCNDFRADMTRAPSSTATTSTTTATT